MRCGVDCFGNEVAFPPISLGASAVVSVRAFAFFCSSLNLGLVALGKGQVVSTPDLLKRTATSFRIQRSLLAST